MVWPMEPYVAAVTSIRPGLASCGFITVFCVIWSMSQMRTVPSPLHVMALDLHGMKYVSVWHVIWVVTRAHRKAQAHRTPPSPVRGMPLPAGAPRNVALGVFLVADVHVAAHKLAQLLALAVVDLGLGTARDSQERLAAWAPAQLQTYTYI